MTTAERRPPSLPSSPSRRAPGARGRAAGPVCHACGRRVDTGPEGTLRIVGVAPREAPRVWVWGPVLVHEGCRYDVRTPYDDEAGYVAVDQAISAT